MPDMDPRELLPALLPVFPLDAILLLPGGVLPLNIFEPRYLNMIDDVRQGDGLLGIIQTRGGDRAAPELARVGCLGQLTSFTETPDGRYLISLAGICRFRVEDEVQMSRPYRTVLPDFELYLEDLDADVPPDTGLADRIQSALKAFGETLGGEVDWSSAAAVSDATLVSSLCMAIPASAPIRQAMLEAPDLRSRLLVLEEAMAALRASGRSSS